MLRTLSRALVMALTAAGLGAQTRAPVDVPPQSKSNVVRDALHAPPVHPLDLEVHAVDLDGVALGGDAPEPGHDQPRQRLVGPVLRHAQAGDLRQLVGPQHAGEAP